MTITVYGEPIGKGRPRFTKNGHIYTPARTKEYEKKIRTAFMEQTGEKLDGPIYAHLTAYMRIPESAPKKRKQDMEEGKIRPEIKPDLDNIVKCLDALNGLAFDDDKSIVAVVAEKWYSNTPRLEIVLEQL